MNLRSPQFSDKPSLLDPLRDAAALDRRNAAAILRKACFVGFDANGALLAVGNRVETSCGHAQAREIVLHGLRATSAKSEVVFARTAFIAMPFEGQCHRAETLQPRGLFLQR